EVASAPYGTGRTRTFAGMWAGKGTDPSLTTTTRAPGGPDCCLMARAMTVRPATRIDAPGMVSAVARMTTWGAGSGDGMDLQHRSKRSDLLRFPLALRHRARGRQGSLHADQPHGRRVRRLLHHGPPARAGGVRGAGRLPVRRRPRRGRGPPDE